MIRHFFIAFKIKSCDDNDFLFLQQIVLYFHLLIHSATASFTLKKNDLIFILIFKKYVKIFIYFKRAVKIKTISKKYCELNVDDRWNNWNSYSSRKSQVGGIKMEIWEKSYNIHFHVLLSINFLSCSIIVIRYIYYYQVFTLNGASY